MAQRVTVAKVGEIPEGRALPVVFRKARVAVFHIDGAYYAMSDTCPHAGGPLHLGLVREKIVSCPWHGWTFELDPGPDAPNDGVIRYPVHVEGDEIQVELPD